ncbi:MAG: hypothetical protein BalsKO_03640 [Balneolaceae bacterium]
MTSTLKILFLFFLSSFGIQDSLSAQDSLATDENSELIIRTPGTSNIEKYASDPDFQYQGVPQNPDSLRDRLVQQLIRFLNFIFGNPIGNFFLKLLLYITIASLVLVLINQLVGGNLVNIFSKKKSETSFTLNIGEEEFQSLDLHALLDEAISKHDFPSATRYLYLITLKMLDEHDLITWGIEKTNIDYERELSGHKGSTVFNSLTSYYEYVEYGDFEIDKIGYELVHDLYNDLKERVEA